MPKSKSKANAALTLPTILRDYFTKTRNITPSCQFIEDSLFNIEDDNRFNPVEDMLKKTKHDGEDRFEVLYEILSLAETSKNAAENDAENTADDSIDNDIKHTAYSNNSVY